MPDPSYKIISPESLEVELKDESDISVKIKRTSNVMVGLLKAIGNQKNVAEVENIISTLIGQDEIYQRLLIIYREVFGIFQRLYKALKSNDLQPEDKLNIQRRATAIVNEQIFLLQREVFFKIVNAKEVAEGEKNEDGPALLYPGIEKIKNDLIQNINQQTQQLRPAAVEACKTFRGIADGYAATEASKESDKGKYDTIAQSYELEQKIRNEIARDISPVKMDEKTYLDGLIESFETLRKTYRLKTISLKDKEPSKVLNFDRKIAILEEGCVNCDKRTKPLKVLQSLAQRLPQLEKQLDFFAESYYQARSVMKFLEEVHEEMSNVFKQHNLESFTVVSFLRYKLNCTSHMYESIHYYHAVVQIEEDVLKSIEKRYSESPSPEVPSEELLQKEADKTGIPDIVFGIHDCIAKMNDYSYDIHSAFLEYKQKTDIEKLRKTLKKRTKQNNEAYSRIKTLYKKAQQVFFGFLSEDLGATEITSQLNTFQKKFKNTPEGIEVAKGFNTLLSTKHRYLESIENEFRTKFGKKVPENKISALAQLKIKMDFQKELLGKVQKLPKIQEFFIHILQQFIKVQDESGKQLDSENSILRITKENYSREIQKFAKEESFLFEKVFKTPDPPERDVIIAFLAANITPQEIESFSRLLPALPRNEYQLDSLYGRILLDIKTLFKERLQSKAASTEHLHEKVYEIREQQKLINNMCKFMQACTDRFFKRIDNEEKKIDTLIGLEQRKFQKELNEVIRYWQYLVQEQISPGQGERGRFRQYRPKETQLMSKYISPEQLNTIERQLESSFDLVAESRLFDVESFLMKVASGLFQYFNEDQRIKAKFGEFEQGQKLRRREIHRGSVEENLLTNPQFVPNIKECIKTVEKVKRRKEISDFLDYWEFKIDQKVPASDKRKKESTSQIDLKPQKNDASLNLTAEQLEQILYNLDLIHKVRGEDVQRRLIEIGSPIIRISQRCFNIFDGEKKAKKLENIDKKHLEEMLRICQNKDSEQSVNTAVKILQPAE
ncbi:MAG: hypothetical protein GY866_29550 [Proteobacteria bacterium]|nr:hypothetical protein [Pseudomonadota bacterium]